MTCAVVTVSDTRTVETDTSGALIRESLMGDGHRVVDHRILKDEPAAISETVRELAQSEVQAIVLTGGTGISPRDGTCEALAAVFDKRLDGFGELFRQLSYEEIGPLAMISRAQAGLVGRCLVFSLPGSTKACRLGMEKVILPCLVHMVKEMTRVEPHGHASH